MSLGEFELIKKYFCQNDRGTGIELGIGDDCALLNLPKNKTLAITTDTQIEGIHFFLTPLLTMSVISLCW